ncbi:unnamed protein product [Victoria cruziana]
MAYMGHRQLPSHRRLFIKKLLAGLLQQEEVRKRPKMIDHYSSPSSTYCSWFLTAGFTTNKGRIIVESPQSHRACHGRMVYMRK